MPVDTSMYNTATPTAVNPLAAMGSVAGIANAVNQNKLFQQTFAARKAIGQAYQQAIDPTTGQVDTNKLMSAVAADPNAGFMAGDVAQQALARQQAQLAVNKQQLDLANAHLTNMNNRMSSLLANPNLDQKTVISSVGDAIAEGLIDPKTAAQELSSMPNDPGQLRGWVQQHMLQNLDSQGKIQALYGKIQPINTGGQTNILAASPMTGVRNLGSIKNTMAPGEAATPITTFNPGTNAPQLITKQQFANDANGVQDGGALPGATPNPANAAPQSSGGAIQNGPGIQAGPSLGAEAAANVQGTQSAQEGVDLQKMADMVPQKKALLGNLDAALNNFTSGKGADWKNVAKNFVNANNPFGNIFDAKSIASQEEFNKQATQLAQAQFQALGGTGTDAKLDSTMHTSPNELLSQMGNKGIIALLKGNEDAIQAKNQAWQEYQQQHGPQSYGAFSTDFNKTYDPRVFQSQYLDGQGKIDMIDNMSAAEKTKFRSAFNNAVDQGWIPDPRSSQGGAPTVPAAPAMVAPQVPAQ